MRGLACSSNDSRAGCTAISYEFCLVAMSDDVPQLGDLYKRSHYGRASQGNRSPEFRQQCTFAYGPAGGKYTLTFEGDYGEHWLAVGKAMLADVGRREARLPSQATLATLHFPDVHMADGSAGRPFSVAMQRVPRCLSDDRDSADWQQRRRG